MQGGHNVLFSHAWMPILQKWSLITYKHLQHPIRIMAIIFSLYTVPLMKISCLSVWYFIWRLQPKCTRSWRPEGLLTMVVLPAIISSFLSTTPSCLLSRPLGSDAALWRWAKLHKISLSYKSFSQQRIQILFTTYHIIQTPAVQRFQGWGCMERLTQVGKQGLSCT